MNSGTQTQDNPQEEKADDTAVHHHVNPFGYPDDHYHHGPVGPYNNPFHSYPPHHHHHDDEDEEEEDDHNHVHDGTHDDSGHGPWWDADHKHGHFHSQYDE